MNTFHMKYIKTEFCYSYMTDYFNIKRIMYKLIQYFRVRKRIDHKMQLYV